MLWIGIQGEDSWFGINDVIQNDCFNWPKNARNSWNNAKMENKL